MSQQENWACEDRQDCALQAPIERSGSSPMERVREFFYGAIRQGLPVVGSISAMVWSTADGVARNRTGTVLRAAGFSGLGWVGGYVTQRLLLGMIDKVASGQLPTEVGELGSMMEPGTMPNPTQYPEAQPSVSSMPPPTILDGEGSQTIKVAPASNVVELPTKDDVQVQGTFIKDAFGAL